MHGVDHNLFDQVEVGETGELHIIGCMVLDKILVRGGCRKFVVFFAKLMIIYSKIRRGLPCGMDSMGHVILSFHKRKRSETIGCKKH